MKKLFPLFSAGVLLCALCVSLPSSASAYRAQAATVTTRTVLVNNGMVSADGTITAAATAGAATLSKTLGVVTSEALTTAGLATYTLTLTNTTVSATSVVMASLANGTNTQGTPAIGLVTPGSGSVVITVNNLHATQALNGTIKIAFQVVK